MTVTHFDHDGRVRFVTFSTHKRWRLLNDDGRRDIVVDAIRGVCAKFNCQLLAWVVMPEHVHLVLVPPLDVKLSDVVSAIKRQSAREIHRCLVVQGSPLLDSLTVTRDGRSRFVFWLRRCFDRNCRTDAECRAAIDYCHLNPVKRGLVKVPEAYRWSSARAWQD